MTEILRLDSSSRPMTGGSRSRELADEIIAQLCTKHPNAKLITRDLAAAPLPHISNETIAGFYTPSEQRTTELNEALALSDKLISEVKSADVVVISVPIYNFSIPSVLKAWIDQITRINETFAYEDGQFAALLPDRPVYLAFAYGAGGYGVGGPLESYDFMRPYLNLLLSFIGLKSITGFAVEATTADQAAVEVAMAKAKADIEAHFAS